MAVTKEKQLFVVFLLLLILVSVVIGFVSSDEESRECSVSKHMKGVCTLVTQCSLAMAALKRGKPHRLKRCGFRNAFDSEEIVCCPTTSLMVKAYEDPTTTRRTTTGRTTTRRTDSRADIKRRCQKYCEEIARDSQSNVVFHIIGGEDAKEEEFPHMAVIGYEIDDEIEWNCGASIISKKHLLTAAHCFTKQIQPTKIRVGVTRLDDPGAQDYDIKNVIVHNEYNAASKHNDIAIVEVEGEMKFSSKVYPACLYHENDDPLGLIITGWGKTSATQEDDRTIALQRAQVVAFNLMQCNRTYATRSMGAKTVNRKQLCATSPPGVPATDACWGDSGGPCQIQNKLGTYSIVSIISYGQQCGSKVPGVYTRVSGYLEWIEDNVWKH